MKKILKIETDSPTSIFTFVSWVSFPHILSTLDNSGRERAISRAVTEELSMRTHGANVVTGYVP